MPTTLSPEAEELKRRLGEPDLLQIQLLMQVPMEKRTMNMLNMQNIILNTWRVRLRAANPHLDDLELTKLVFKRLYQNG